MIVGFIDHSAVARHVFASGGGAVVHLLSKVMQFLLNAAWIGIPPIIDSK